jgi:hypothetical protein
LKEGFSSALLELVAPRETLVVTLRPQTKLRDARQGGAHAHGGGIAAGTDGGDAVDVVEAVGLGRGLVERTPHAGGDGGIEGGFLDRDGVAGGVEGVGGDLQVEVLPQRERDGFLERDGAAVAVLAAGAWASAAVEVRLRASRARTNERGMTNDGELTTEQGNRSRCNNTEGERKLLSFILAPRGAFQHGEAGLSGARDGNRCRKFR